MGQNSFHVSSDFGLESNILFDSNLNQTQVKYYCSPSDDNFFFPHNRFSKFVHWRTSWKIASKIDIKHPATP